MLTLIGLVFSAFIATNLDNLLLLVVLLGSNPGRRPAVLGGYIVSCAAVICASVAALLLSSLLQTEVLGYLGLAPIFMGIHMLYQRHATDTTDATDQAEVGSSSADRPTQILVSSFLLLFSNSGDSIAVFLPLFAESSLRAMPVLLGSYLAIAVIWGLLSYGIAGRRELAILIERRTEKLVPWIMIGVGIYILMDTATDSLI